MEINNHTYLVHRDAREGCYLLPEDDEDNFTFNFLRDHHATRHHLLINNNTKSYIDPPSWFMSPTRSCVNITKSLKMTIINPDEACRLEIDRCIINSGSSQSSPLILSEFEFGEFRNPSIQYLNSNESVFIMVSRTVRRRMFEDLPLFHFVKGSIADTPRLHNSTTDSKRSVRVRLQDGGRITTVNILITEPIENIENIQNVSMLGYEDSRMIDITHMLLSDAPEIALSKKELQGFYTSWGGDDGRRKLYLISTTEATRCDPSQWKCTSQLVNRMKYFFLAFDAPTKRFYVTKPEYMGILVNCIYRQREKNWTPFIYNNSIMYVHEIFPLHIISLSKPSGDASASVSVTDQTLSPHFNISGTLNLQSVSNHECSHIPFPWSFGEPRGGSNALLVKVPADAPPLSQHVRADHNNNSSSYEYLAIFHAQHHPGSTIFHEREVAPLSYWVGAYTFSAHPPFKLLRISHVPIVKSEWYDGPWIFKASWAYIPYPMGLFFEENGVGGGAHDVNNDQSTVLASIGLQEGRKGILVRMDLKKIFRTMAILEC